MVYSDESNSSLAAQDEVVFSAEGHISAGSGHIRTKVYSHLKLEFEEEA